MDLPLSARLRPDVALYAVTGGHVLRTGDTHHHVHLDPPELDALVDALVAGREPHPPRARAALASLVAAGLADPQPGRVRVTGTGVLAGALRAALVRMGADTSPDAAPDTSPGGTLVLALDHDDLPDGGDLGATACWVSGHRVLLAPPAVPAGQVAARHHAATLHRDTDRRVARRSGAGVRSGMPALAGAGLELAAVQVAAELLRAERPAYEVVVVDLVALTTSRHPVLPVPPAPR
ncbi:hypothetical protein [Pimelobacter simplex]|uniref:hypothetical protein n=1 Tax=Nocardioides simplex TaxID=2045 RepID=UPI00214F773A|nr:hypothetical protein [Pimelobacter simplex]UUW91066.1 hypothetical protein M0M43_06180 [Pimelobacter simplex]UUW94894.1 hypothetical protein M0M48_24685 [Pimelobacter simplex]